MSHMLQLPVKEVMDPVKNQADLTALIWGQDWE